jgi:periplasmic copper chaperone A
MKLRPGFLFLLFALLVAACAPATPAVSQNGIEIYNPKVRMAGLGLDASLAGYMLIKNTAAQSDWLVGADCDFADAALHESKIEGNVMTMNAIESVEIPGGQMLELRPGSYHIMLTSPKRELKVGDTVTLVLKFKQAGDVSVPVLVSDK